MQVFYEVFMLIGISKELPDWEYRTALIPEDVAELTKQNNTVYIEADSGIRAGYDNAEYISAGAYIVNSAKEVADKSEILLFINPPNTDGHNFFHSRQMLISNFAGIDKAAVHKIVQKQKISILALEKLPRLSRVQDIDILSSQNNLAGYKAALIAVNMQNSVIPLMITSAGTSLPLKALVIGAGVAGLQATATLHRMGANVYCSDIRAETAAQVTSLGATFIAADHIPTILKECHILITTALNPNGKPPLLVSAEMLKNMPYGSIAIDLAVGNIENARKDTLITFENVKLSACSHLAADIAHTASLFYSHNMLNLLTRLPDLQKDAEIWPHIFIG
jgi:NAD(P) transhydrogenase subunit alpha